MIENKGFTLIELLIVMVVLGLISCFVVEAFKDIKPETIINTTCEKQPSGIGEPLIINVEGCTK